MLLGVIALGVLGGIAQHTTAVYVWIQTAYRVQQLVARKAGQLAHVLPRRTPTGEVLSVASSDVGTFGALMKATDELEYAIGFYFCLILGEDYQKIVKNEILLESTITAMMNEKNWDTGDLPYDVCIFFIYIFE